MREFFREYLHIITTSFTALLFGLGFFYLLLNLFHSSSMAKTVYVNKGDLSYQQMSQNINIIDENLSKYQYSNKSFEYDVGMMESISSKLRVCSTMLKDEGSFYSLPENTEASFAQVYDVNNYFINTLMDKCFISNVSWIIRDENVKSTPYTDKVRIYENYANSLVDNAKYLRLELRDNSSYYFNTGISNAMTRNNIASIYQKVLRNYADFSSIIADLSKYLVEVQNG